MQRTIQQPHKEKHSPSSPKINGSAFMPAPKPETEAQRIARQLATQANTGFNSKK